MIVVGSKDCVHGRERPGVSSALFFQVYKGSFRFNSSIVTRILLDTLSSDILL